MRHKKTTFALFFGNRGFFPSKLMKEAREEFPRLLDSLGFGCLMMEEKATRYGAVSTAAEGQVFANFLRQNRGKYQGIILSLPNFGDETAAVAALGEADVPILMTWTRWPRPCGGTRSAASFPLWTCSSSMG